MLLLPSVAALVLLLASFVDGIAAPYNVPRTLRQATREEVVSRLRRVPDGSWTAKRSTVSAPPCGGIVAGGGICGCTFVTLCATELPAGTLIVSTATPSFSECITICDDDAFQCRSLNYEISTGTCTIYQASTTGGTSTPGYEAAYLDLSVPCSPGC